MSQRRIEPPVALSAFHELLRKHGIPKRRYDGSRPEDAIHARRTEAIVNLNHIIEPSVDMLSVIPKRGVYSWIRDDVAFAVAHGTMPERFAKKALLMLKLWEVSIPMDYSILLAKGERYTFHHWHVTDAGKEAISLEHGVGRLHTVACRNLAEAKTHPCFGRRACA